jgi:hypothetical protein
LGYFSTWSKPEKKKNNQTGLFLLQWIVAQRIQQSDLVSPGLTKKQGK